MTNKTFKKIISRLYKLPKGKVTKWSKKAAILAGKYY